MNSGYLSHKLTQEKKELQIMLMVGILMVAVTSDVGISMSNWSSMCISVHLSDEIEASPQHNADEKNAAVADKLDKASAVFQRAELMKRQGRFSEAYNQANAARDLARDARGIDSAEYARCLDLLGRIDLAVRDFRRAEFNLETARTILEVQDLQKWRRLQIGVLCNLGNAKRKLSKFDEAQELFHEASKELDNLGQTPESEMTKLAISLFRGNVLLDMGDIARAGNLIEPTFHSIQIEKEKNENLHIAALVAMGNLHRLRHELEESEKCLARASELTSKRHGRRSIEYADILEYFSDLYKAQGKSVLAIDRLEQSISLRQQLLGEDHPIVARSRSKVYNLQTR